MIEVTDLRKRYGPIVALDGLSLRVAPGEVLGLLGHNGAGKSTFARILAGLVRPDAGTARLAGHDVVTAPLAARARFAYLAEESVVYPELTPREHLELIAGLRRVAPAVAAPRAARLLEFLDLGHAADRAVAGFSRGMRRKLAIAMALVGDPEVLLFDEPTDGLDPDGARRFAELLDELRRRGRAVIVQTHVLGLAERRCDRLAVIDRGRVLAEGDADALRARAGLPGADLEDVFLELTGRGRRDARGVLDGPGAAPPGAGPGVG